MVKRHLLSAPVLGLLTGVWLPAPAQQADNSQYLGSAECEECHRQGYRRFQTTKMAKVFFDAPRNQLESRGCEACHGPGREHAQAERERDRARARGVPYEGPKSSEFITRFGKDAPLSARAQNARCLQCHDKGQRMFWKGSSHEARGMACVTCHQIHKKDEPVLAAARFTEPLSDNRLLVKGTQTQVCFGCHPMRRAH